MTPGTVAADLVRSVARPTVVVEAPRLADVLGIDVVLALEIYQWTGSFKFRAAYNVAASVPNRHVVAASSGNFGQALAYACRLLGKTCTIVMPETSSQVKIDAVRAYGGQVDLIDTTMTTRARRVEELAGAAPEAYVASAYDDDLVIEGNSSLGYELQASVPDLGTVVAPIGGGGLASGLVLGLRRSCSKADVYAAEPLMANDAARTLRAGRIIRNDHEPATIADGARTVSIGERNWDILRTGLAGIIEVPEDAIRRALRLLLSEANVKAEATGALAVAALLSPDRPRMSGRVCCVISGGNVDPDVYIRLAAA